MPFNENGTESQRFRRGRPSKYPPEKMAEARALRDHTGLNLTEIATKVGVPLTTIRHWFATG